MWLLVPIGSVVPKQAENGWRALSRSCNEILAKRKYFLFWEPNVKLTILVTYNFPSTTGHAAQVTVVISAPWAPQSNPKPLIQIPPWDSSWLLFRRVWTRSQTKRKQNTYIWQQTNLVPYSNALKKQQSSISTFLQCLRPPCSESTPTPGTIAPTTAPVKPSDFYSNSKFEDIACRPIRPAYDGTNAKLLLFLNKLHLRRQNEIWCSSTYLPLMILCTT